ncbi:MAG: TM2 domain-containing protein [Bacteroidetes bacterium]|nr:TM2 domain-containing protein [Bacteroidota bacterium]
MKGQVLDYAVQTNSGLISGEDGKRYTFNGSDWNMDGVPVRGMTVDFVPEGEAAVAIYKATGSAATGAPGQKNKMAAGLLAILLGGIGIHKFYLGFTGPGLVYLLVNTVGFLVTWILLFIPNIVLGVMALIEGIIYLTKTDEEFTEMYEVQKKQWF